jgi:hypothetical protein
LVHDHVGGQIRPAAPEDQCVPLVPRRRGCRAEDEPQNRRGDTRVAQGLLDSCASVM